MRFLSPHQNFSIQVFEGAEVRETDSATGQAYTRTVKTPVMADFSASQTAGGLYPHEVEIALEAFEGNWGALPENVNPVTRISVWDSEAQQIAKGWTDEYHEAVVKRMVELSADRSQRMVAVPDKWRAKPWNTYDEMSTTEILKYIEALGSDPMEIRLYEGENQGRGDLIDALDALSRGEAVDLADEDAETEDRKVIAQVTV